MHGSGLFGNPFGGLSGLGPGGLGPGLGYCTLAEQADALRRRGAQEAFLRKGQEQKNSQYDNGEIIDVEGREVIPGNKRIEFGENQ